MSQPVPPSCDNQKCLPTLPVSPKRLNCAPMRTTARKCFSLGNKLFSVSSLGLSSNLISSDLSPVRTLVRALYAPPSTLGLLLVKKTMRSIRTRAPSDTEKVLTACLLGECMSQLQRQTTWKGVAQLSAPCPPSTEAMAQNEQVWGLSTQADLDPNPDFPAKLEGHLFFSRPQFRVLGTATCTE